MFVQSSDAVGADADFRFAGAKQAPQSVIGDQQVPGPCASRDAHCGGWELPTHFHSPEWTFTLEHPSGLIGKWGSLSTL